MPLSDRDAAGSHEAVLDVLSVYVHRRGIPVLVPSPHLTPAVDGPDSPDITNVIDEAPDTAWHDLVAQKIGIEYADADGVVTRRRINVRGIAVRGAAIYLNAFCHERKAPRQFRLDRVRSWVDLTSGEVFDAAWQLLAAIRDHVDHRPGAQVARALAAERQVLNVVVPVMRCDGVHPSEVEVLSAHMLNLSAGHARLPEEELRRHLGRLSPDMRSFERAVRGLRTAPADVAGSLARLVRRVVDADRYFTTEEHDIVARVSDLSDGRLR
jgi:hypothetical protein